MTHKEMIDWLSSRHASIQYFEQTEVRFAPEERFIHWRVNGRWLSISDLTNKESLEDAIIRAIEYENTCLGGLLVA